MDITVRAEERGDIAAIHRLNAAAFPSPAEATLVDKLRDAGSLTLSLVAVMNNEVVGHIGFSPVTVTNGDKAITAAGLAPMAVAPAHQRATIGSQLVRAGLAELERQYEYPFVVVLGHPGYYPRFGFNKASEYGVKWEIDAPDEAFMVRELKPGGLDGVSGVVSFSPEFMEV